MTQFSNATFSVGGRHCDGCSQRDVWLKQKDEQLIQIEKRLEELEAYIDELTDELEMR